MTIRTEPPSLVTPAHAHAPMGPGDHRGVGDAIVRQVTVLAAGEHTGAMHQTEVARDVGLCRVDLHDDLRHGFFGFTDGMHDAQAHRFGQHAEIRGHSVKYRIQFVHAVPLRSIERLNV